jgi:hypothetical protein
MSEPAVNPIEPPPKTPEELAELRGYVDGVVAFLEQRVVVLVDLVWV